MSGPLIMKFGGTSVGSPSAISRTRDHVAAAGGPTVVVASAMGGVTDLLLSAADLAERRRDYLTVFQRIVSRHRGVVDAFDLDASEVEELHDELEELLQGIAMLRELSLRTRDRLVSIGERVSVRLLAAALNASGHPARPIDAWDFGMLTDRNFGQAEPLPGWQERVAAAFAGLPAGVTPVVTGFIGKTEDGSVATLGRGGSDFSAALFGAALGAREIQIWTDVPGFLKADPSVVDQPGLIPELRFEEAAELAYFGAKVLHPRTIEPARKAAIPVRILGTFEVTPGDLDGPYSNGTLISDKASEATLRALALRRNVHTLHVHSSRMLDAPGFLARLLDVFARHDLSVDVVATSEVSVSMTFDCAPHKLERALAEAAEFARVEVSPNRAIICVVGDGLRTDPGLLARIFATCSDHGVPVHVISQGASRLNLTLVTDSSAAATAMKALHDELLV